MKAIKYCQNFFFSMNLLIVGKFLIDKSDFGLDQLKIDISVHGERPCFRSHTAKKRASKLRRVRAIYADGAFSIFPIPLCRLERIVSLQLDQK